MLVGPLQGIARLDFEMCAGEEGGGRLKLCKFGRRGMVKFPSLVSWKGGFAEQIFMSMMFSKELI